MDNQGNIVIKDKAFGYKCTHELVRSEMCLGGDKVSTNDNMTEDRNKVGKFTIPKRMVPKLASGTKNSHFTLIGVTSLTSKPVMFILILFGKKENPTHAMSITNKGICRRCEQK